jgi:hypothetical protein
LQIKIAESALQPLAGAAQLGLAGGLGDSELLCNLGMAVALEGV